MRNTRIAAALIAALALAACSSGSGTTGTASTTTTDGGEAKTFRVGMECNYAPFNWTTTEAGEFTQPLSESDYCDGYDVYIASTIARTIGRDVQIVKTDWDALIIDLQQGSLDAIIAGMTETPERAEQVSFTTPYYVSPEVVIVKADSDLANITDIQELSGYKVQGQMGTLYDTIIDDIDGVNHVPAATDFPAAINSLQHGDVDAVTSELPVAIGVCAANPDLTYVQFEAGHGFTSAGDEGGVTVSIAIAKENTDLLNEVQAALDQISEDDRASAMEAAVLRQPASEE
ncbi:MAG: transporter substrate-binding domain-containing protein [Solobacterium sp.]|nr:transporter substrate-binding domain-containing protein [Solobacterium sp.]